MDSPSVAAANALSAIVRSGAVKFGLPSVNEVLWAKPGKKWFGEKKDGSHWMLVKHSQSSYNVTC